LAACLQGFITVGWTTEAHPVCKKRLNNDTGLILADQVQHGITVWNNVLCVERGKLNAAAHPGLE